MAKSEQKIKARLLRKKGISIKTIAKELSVSTGSISSWCRDIPLTAKQILQLQKNKTNPYYGRRGEYIKKVIDETNKKVESLKNE